MISIAVVGGMLAIGYLSINDSQQKSVNARDLTQVTQVVEGQIEALKALALTEIDFFDDLKADLAKVSSSQKNFCLAAGRLHQPTVVIPADSSVCDLGDLPDTIGLKVAIEFDFQEVVFGQTGSTTSDPKLANNLFAVTADWQPVASNNRQSIQFYYRIHPPAEVFKFNN